jgi:hypothetical protein
VSHPSLQAMVPTQGASGRKVDLRSKAFNINIKRDQRDDSHQDTVSHDLSLPLGNPL